jgi:hypothetical protein
MKMKKTIALACVCGAVALVSQSAMAEGLKVRGGVTNNSYSLDITPSAGGAYNYATSSYNGNSLGLTWMMTNEAYLDFATSSGTGSWTGKYAVNNVPNTGASFTSDLKRSDNALVLGVNSANAGGTFSNIYVGWKNGETDLTRAPGASTNPSLAFKTSGLVFGGGWGIPAAGGTVGLSLGMGLMSGQYDSIKSTGSTSYKADMALGFSYGIGYTYPFTPNFGISADYKGNIYNYTYDSGLTTEWSLNEKFNTTSASLYLKF